MSDEPRPVTLPRPPRFRVLSGVNAGREFVAAGINFEAQTVRAFEKPAGAAFRQGWLFHWSEVEFLHVG